MFSHITILTLEIFKPAFFSIMEKYCDGVRYNFAFDWAMFEDVLKNEKIGKDSMLLSFGTGVIVKQEELDQFGLCLNIHPGSPEYPGLHPHAFAWADGVKHFGATVHHMTASIDEGAIIMSESFEVLPSWDEEQLLDHAVYKSLEMSDRLLQSLFEAHTIPTPLSLSWGAHRYTKKEFDALREKQTGKKQSERCAVG